ncbi:MAG: septum formation initiator family protein [Desulfotomaculum sp.]|nr:septum formation initiator family protein [Desulfotomaculum sp.]
MISSSVGRGKALPFKKPQPVKHKKSRLKIKYKISLPLIILLLIFGYLVLSIGGEIDKLNNMQHSVAELEQEMQLLQERNSELRQTLTLLESENYVEQVAREQLGLVKPGETLIVPAN